MNIKYSQEIINSAKDLIEADRIANDALAEKWNAESRFFKIRSLWHSDECEKDLYLNVLDKLELASQESRIANRKFEISLEEFRVLTNHLWAMRDTDSASLLHQAKMIISQCETLNEDDDNDDDEERNDYWSSHIDTNK